MVSIIIHGFKNEAAASEFISWYSGQGEQDIYDWWSCRKQEGKDLGGNSPMLDDAKTWHEGRTYDGNMIKDENGNLIAFMK